MAGRDLDRLLRIIGVEGSDRLLLPSDPRILDAFERADITAAEARMLQGFANADAKSQKRRLAVQRGVGSADIEKTKAKLAGLRAELEKRHLLRGGDVL